MDWTEHRRTMLRHCLWMAGISPAYALSAARKYEADSYGVLEGLAQKVEEAIERHKERVNADRDAAEANRLHRAD